MTCQHSRGRPIAALAIALLVLVSSIVAAQGNSSTQLRRYIDQQVGGIQKLMVPAHNTELPQPRLANGNPDPQFETTEAKRYLGNCSFTTRREQPGLSRSSVASSNTVEPRPAEPVISARRHRSPARASISPPAGKDEASRTPTGTSLRVDGRLRTCRSCGRRRSSRATPWLTRCPR
jgi:hypothetical protein